MIADDPELVSVVRLWVQKAENDLVTRYPGDYEPITLTEARRAVILARSVRRQVRRWLPKPAL